MKVPSFWVSKASGEKIRVESITVSYRGTGPECLACGCPRAPAVACDVGHFLYHFKPAEPECSIESTFCAKHGFQHGKEAEELREGVEAIIRRFSDKSGFEGILLDLSKMLDKVDARDSVAFLEAEDR